MKEVFSEVRFEKVERTKVARYVIVSPMPENDVITRMDKWAEENGILEIEGFTPRKWGWDFPFVPKNLTEKFGLRGYVYCYTLPNDFEIKACDVEITYIEADEYTVLRITEPFKAPFERIPEGWKRLMGFVESSEYKTSSWENRIAFEEVVLENGVEYMDVYMPIR